MNTSETPTQRRYTIIGEYHHSHSDDLKVSVRFSHDNHTWQTMLWVRHGDGTRLDEREFESWDGLDRYMTERNFDSAGMNHDIAYLRGTEGVQLEDMEAWVERQNAEYDAKRQCSTCGTQGLARDDDYKRCWNCIDDGIVPDDAGGLYGHTA